MHTYQKGRRACFRAAGRGGNLPWLLSSDIFLAGAVLFENLKKILNPFCGEEIFFLKCIFRVFHLTPLFCEMTDNFFFLSFGTWEVGNVTDNCFGCSPPTNKMNKVGHHWLHRQAKLLICSQIMLHTSSHCLHLFSHRKSAIDSFTIHFLSPSLSRSCLPSL